MAWSIPWDLLGTTISGDIGGYTVYTDRYGRPTVFPKDTPSRPPSLEQIERRSRFKLAQAAWSALTADQKRTLEAACRNLSLPLTGQNLYISTSLRGDPEAYATVQQQSGLTLPPVVYV